MKKLSPKNVVIITSLKLPSGQKQLAGILDANLERFRWSLSVVDNKSATLQCLRQLLASGTDGFIIHLPCAEEAMRLLLGKTDIPTVLVNIGGFHIPRDRRPISYLWTDNQELGRQGAEHFLSKNGYRSFAFVYSKSYENTADGFWSRERKRGFCERLGQEGIPFLTQSADGRLDDWLRSIPKPTALMASYDAIAVRLARDCSRLGISVPNEISILGVDDIGSNNLDISSVNIDFYKAGQMEVQELDKLMQRPERNGPNEVMIPSKGLLCRKSTALPAHSDVTARALKFIAQNACSGISVNDVVLHLGCSRRLAEIKFRQSTKRTIKAEIERIRLLQASKLMKKRNNTLGNVALKCGYSSATILSRALARSRANGADKQRHPPTDKNFP